jgi:UDP-galactopyranose mutase
MKVLIVGAGLSGCTIAERLATLGHNITIIEKRDHIGGNCYDYYNEHNILISKYGAHLFHTKHKIVEDYVKQFADSLGSNRGGRCSVFRWWNNVDRQCIQQRWRIIFFSC